MQSFSAIRWRQPPFLKALVFISTMGIAALGACVEVPETLISLEIRETPLQDVLQEIAGQTGYTFIFESTWGEHPISARLKNASIQAGLRRILSGMNHALIYLPERTVRIVITEKSLPHGVGGGGSSTAAPARERVPFIPIPASPLPQDGEVPSAPDQTGQAADAGTVEAAVSTENQPAAE
jgi:type II secretory pathway component GspD/PulD (secretin)